MSGSTVSTEIKRKKKRKRQVWRTSSSLMSIELKWRGEDHQKYLTACENLWKGLREEHRREREYHKYYLGKLVADVGPAWYQELSNPQRRSLSTLALMMHMDIGQGTPSRVMRILADLGILPRFKGKTVMGALNRSNEDPIMFLVELYNVVYESDPSEEQDNYILEQRLLISAIVFLGIQDIIEMLDRQTKYVWPPSKPFKAPPRRKKPPPPKSVYLAPDPFIPLISTAMYTPRPPAPDPLPLSDQTMKQFGLMTDDEDEDDEDSTKSSVRGNKKAAATDKENEPESTHNIITLPITKLDTCSIECECIKWYPAIVRYINQKRWEAEELKRLNAKAPKKKSPRKGKGKGGDCGSSESKTKTSKNASGKNMNKRKKPEKKRFKHPIKINTFLKILLAEQADSKMFIASLPNAYQLPILQEWARRRLRGGNSNAESEKIRLSQNVRWRFLLRERTRIPPPKLPFSDEKLFSMNWNMRSKINKLVEDLHTEYHKKVKRKLIKTGQLWWPTMEMQKFPNKNFRDVYFSYIPGREEDIYVKHIKSVESA